MKKIIKKKKASNPKKKETSSSASQKTYYRKVTKPVKKETTNGASPKIYYKSYEMHSMSDSNGKTYMNFSCEDNGKRYCAEAKGSNIKECVDKIKNKLNNVFNKESLCFESIIK